jgi:hypothetical protein
MAKKAWYLLVDTETTLSGRVVDFGAIIVDRNGEIHKRIAVLIKGIFGVEELFFDVNSKDEIWTKRGLEKRNQNYVEHLNNGTRMLASVSAINKWLMQAMITYSPSVTAFNLAFDKDKCQKTGIDLSIFTDQFCLWHAAIGHFGSTKAFRAFVLDNHCINPPTELRNCTYQTNAEVMASFLSGGMLPPEPHTSIEDCIDYELPILRAILKRKKWREKIKPYNWRDYQLRHGFIAK